MDAGRIRRVPQRATSTHDAAAPPRLDRPPGGGAGRARRAGRPGPRRDQQPDGDLRDGRGRRWRSSWRSSSGCSSRWAGPRAESGGVLTHGGSLANLTAMLAARARAAPDAWVDGVPGDLALLAPADGSLLGGPQRRDRRARRGRDRARSRPTTLGRILPDPIGRRARARARGRPAPMALVADACATGTGLHDDLARDRRVVPRARASGSTWTGRTAPRRSCPRATAGCSTASSRRTRWCGTPTRCCARRASAPPCWCATSRDLPGAFQQEASYLFYEDSRRRRHHRPRDRVHEGAARGEAVPQPRLARRARAGRLRGRPVRQGAAASAALIGERPGFECPYRPESNILCFRYGRRLAAPAGDPRATDRERRVPPQLGGARRRALPAHRCDEPGHRRGDDRAPSERHRKGGLSGVYLRCAKVLAGRLTEPHARRVSL